MFWKISWWRIRFSCRYVCCERAWDRNHLYSIIRENKHQAPTYENTDSNIDKLPWILIIGPRIKKKIRKTGCRVIFTSAAKLKNILCNNESKLLPNSYPGVYRLSCDCGGGIYYRNKKNACSLNQLNTKKIAWQENEKHRVQLNIPKNVMGDLISCNQKRLQNCPTYTNGK